MKDSNTNNRLSEKNKDATINPDVDSQCLTRTEWDAVWLDEINKRIKQIECSSDALLPHDEVMTSLRFAL